MTLLSESLRFRSKNPKIIDLSGGDLEEKRMPETLEEKAIRCRVEEKDLYTYYFLKE